MSTITTSVIFAVLAIGLISAVVLPTQSAHAATPTILTSVSVSDTQTRVIFNEPVKGTLLLGDWLFATQAPTIALSDVSGVGAGGTLANDNNILFTHPTTADETPSIQYTQGDVNANSDNAVLASQTINALDGILPTFVSATTLDGTGSLVTIVLTFSEPMTDAGTVVADYTVAGTVAANGIAATIVGAAGNNVTITTQAGAMTDADGPITVQFTATTGGSLDDAAGNEFVEIGAFAVTNSLDTTVPTIVSAAVTSTTTIAVTFSENPVNNGSVQADFILTGTLANATNCAGAVLGFPGGLIMTCTTDAALTDADIINLTYPVANGDVGDTALPINNLVAPLTNAGNAVAVTNGLDTSGPVATSATLNLNDTNRQLVINFNESLDLDSFITANNIRIGPSGGAYTILMDAAVQNNAGNDAPTVSFTLTEAQRVQAVALTSFEVQILAGAVRDRTEDGGIPTNNALQLVAAPTNLVVTNDSTLPTVAAAGAVAIVLTPTAGQGGIPTVQITVSETVDVTPATQVNLAGLFISVPTQSNQVALTGATLTTAVDGTVLNFNLTEAQRAAIIGLGNTANLELDISAGALRDVSGNLIAAEADRAGVGNITADATVPAIVTSTINLNDNNRQLILTFDEPIDVTPAANVVLANFDIGLNNCNQACGIGLDNATLNTLVDGASITITLTEAQRAAVAALVTVEVGITPNAVQDISGNLVVASATDPVVTPDITSPTITDVVMNTDTNVRLLTVTFNEAIDVLATGGTTNPPVLSSLFISEAGQVNQIALTTATENTAADGNVVTIFLTPALLTSILVLNTPQLDVSAAGFTDISGNAIGAIADRAITLTSDVVPPQLVSATLDLDPAVRTLTVVFNETIDATPDTSVVLGNIFFSEQNAINGLALTGAAVTQADGTSIIITVTEAQRAFASALTIAELDITAGAFTDISGNAIAAVPDTVINITGDVGAPTVTAVTLNLNPGAPTNITITWSEAISIAVLQNVILANIFVSGAGETNTVSLVDAFPINPAADGTALTFTITEAQRAAIVALNTPQLDLNAGAVQDLAGNANAAAQDIAIVITPDGTVPTVAPGTTTLNLSDNNRQLVLGFSEAMDATPATNVNLAGIFISATGNVNEVSLVGATVTPTDGTTITITLNEAQRAAIIGLAQQEVDIGAGALIDISGNALANSQNVTPNLVTADGTAPTLVSATVNLDRTIRTITFVFSETMDVANNVVPAAFSFGEAGAADPASALDFTGGGTGITTTTNGLTVVFTFSPADIETLAAFTVPGMSVAPAGSIDDVTGNTLATIDPAIALTLVADAAGPTVIAGTALDFNAIPATLSITFDEQLDLTTNLAATVNLANIFVSATGQTNQISLAGATITAADFNLGTAIIDANTLDMLLTESQRQALIAIAGPELDLAASAVTDMSGNVNAISSNNAILVTVDNTAPLFNAAAATDTNWNNDPAVRTLTLTYNEALDVSATVLGSIFFSTAAGGGANEVSLAGSTITTSDSNTMKIVVTPAKLIQIDNLGAAPQIETLAGHVSDIAGNPAVALLNVTVNLNADITAPVVDPLVANNTTLTLAPGAAVMVITALDASGAIDHTPVTNIDLEKIFVSGATQVNTVSLAGATVTAAGDALTITITLTEAQRAAITALTTPQLDVLAGAFKDLNQNFVVNSPDNTINLTADVTAPTIAGVTLNEDPTSRALVVTFNEAVDATAATQVNLNSLFISDINQANQVSLAGATVTPLDGAVITITITEAQRAAIVAQGTPQLDVNAGAFRDISNNAVGPLLNTAIVVTADGANPNLVSATLDLNPASPQLVITADEALDATPATFVVVASLGISSTGANQEIPLTGATVTAVDGVNIIITLTEAQRAAAVALPSHELDVLANAVRDIQGNTIAAAQDIPISLTTDTTAPTINAVTLNIDPANRTLAVTFNETIDATPSSAVDLTKIFVSDANQTNQIALLGAATTATDGTTINIVLTEAQRAQAAVLVTPQLDVQAGAFTDIAGNAIAGVNDTAITTIDLTRPLIVTARYIVDTGVITMTFNEEIDVTPATNVDLTKIFVSLNGAASQIALTSAAVTSTVDGKAVDITLDTATKGFIDALATQELDISANAVRDLTGNLILAVNDTVLVAANAIAAPQINAPEDGDTFASGLVQVTGTYAPTETVTIDIIADGTTNVGTLAADGTGIFAITTVELADGTHTLVARATDQFADFADSTSISITIGTIPVLDSVLIASNNTDPTQAVAGDIVTLTFVADQVIQNVVVTIDGNAAVATASAGTWTATRTMQAGDTVGVIAFTIDFENLNAAAGVQVTATTDEGSVTFTSVSAGISDLAVIRDGFWFIDTNLDGVADIEVGFGLPTDTLFQGDFNGDGIDDLVVNRDGFWFIDTNRDGDSLDAGDIQVGFGLPTDTLFRGDFNGDGIDDLVVNRDGFWFIDTNRDGDSLDATDIQVGFGLPTDTLFVGDFNGDGGDDITVNRDGFWFIDTNHDGTADIEIPFGLPTDTLLVGDFNGDGVDDLTVNRDGFWFIDTNLDGVADIEVPFGLPTDLPFVGDFNGDGVSDLVVNRDGFWFIDTNLDGTADIEVPFGLPTDTAFVGNFGGS